MNQTELGAAIEAAKGEATEVKTVKVDIFDIPETKAEEYIATREAVAEAAAQVMKPYCVTVKRETLDEDEGEAVVGYYVTDGVVGVRIHTHRARSVHGDKCGNIVEVIGI